MPTVNGYACVAIVYRQYALLDPSVTVGLETSTDMVNWYPVDVPDVDQQIGTDSTKATNDPIMEIGIRATGAGAQFVRLKVSQ
jgi:hypothetical protein